MKYDIKNRFNSKVQFTAEIECEADKLDSFKIGLAVKCAIKAGADLAGADLTGAYLADAYLADANLAGADKTKYDVPTIPKIDAVILAEIEKGGTLDMSAWHGSQGWCGTTHCRAGWAVHCAGKPGKALEDKIGTQRAAAMIYRASRPGKAAPWFFASTEAAMADIKTCAAEQLVAAK